MEQGKPTFDTYDPYEAGPQIPPALAEYLATEVPAGYVKVKIEGERILEPVTAEKNRLDMLIEEFNPMLRLVKIDGGYEVYIPEMFTKGQNSER